MAWQDSINNTALAKALTAGLQQFGQNRQQGIPIGRGYESGTGTTSSVINAMRMGQVNALESAQPTQMSINTSIPMSSETNTNAQIYQPAMSVAPTQNTSTGGGGGDSRLAQLEKTDRNPAEQTEYERLLSELEAAANQGPTEEELNALYNPAMDYLNQAESTLRGQLPSTLSLLEQQAGTSRQMLGDQRTSAQGQLGEQGTQVTQRKEDAISAARRLFGELQMANQQRFGGASSAGQAASELQGRELMSNRAGIGRDFGTAMRQIEMSKADVDNQYQTGLRTIEDRKQQSINEVNADFQSKLLEINSQRAATEQAKAAARLEALQAARDRVFQINLQDFNFKQQLEAQKQAADQQISQYTSALQTQVGAGQNATNQMLSNQSGVATTSYGLGGQTPTMQSGVYRGQIGTRPEDEYVGQISPTTRRATDLLSSGQFNTQNLLGL